MCKLEVNWQSHVNLIVRFSNSRIAASKLRWIVSRVLNMIIMFTSSFLALVAHAMGPVPSPLTVTHCISFTYLLHRFDIELKLRFQFALSLQSCYSWFALRLVPYLSLVFGLSTKKVNLCGPQLKIIKDTTINPHMYCFVYSAERWRIQTLFSIALWNSYNNKWTIMKNTNSWEIPTYIKIAPLVNKLSINDHITLQLNCSELIRTAVAAVNLWTIGGASRSERWRELGFWCWSFFLFIGVALFAKPQSGVCGGGMIGSCVRCGPWVWLLYVSCGNWVDRWLVACGAVDGSVEA